MFAEEPSTANTVSGLLGHILSFPVVALVIVLIFYRQLKKLFQIILSKISEQDLSGIEVGAKGVKVNLQKIDTTLGPTQVSVQKVAVSIEQSDLTTYSNGQYQFRISWNERAYSGSIEAAKSLENMLHQGSGFQNQAVPFVIIRKSPVAGVAPNVNVIVEPVSNDLTVAQYMHTQTLALKNEGFEVLSSTIDEKSNGGFVEYKKAEQGFQFAKFVVAQGMAYVITATVLIKSGSNGDSQTITQELLLTPEIRNELRTILNSFELTYTQKGKSG